MDDKKIYLASTAIELSEEADKPYIELKNRLCYYGEPNLNDVVLPVDGAEEKAQTLVNMPVQAKYKVGKDGKTPDLGGHEAYVDKDGDVCFATESIGTHTTVEVKDDTVVVNGVTKTLPCLFSTSRIWKRNKNIIKAIKELYQKNALHSSWEIATRKFSFEDGIKTLTDYEFLGNCLLGSTVPGAYPCAVALDMASLEQSENELAEAFTIDKEEENLAKTKEIVDVAEEVVEPAVEEPTETPAEPTEEPEVPAVSEETPAEPEAPACDDENKDGEPETSALTEWDLRMKIAEACTKVHGDYCWVSFWFPEEHTVWCEYCGRHSELEYLLFTYEVNGDEVTASEPEVVTLTVSPAQINSTLAAKDEALVKASEEINSLKDEIATLQPYKDAADKAELEKAEAEKAEKRNALKSYALKSKFITESEFNKEDEKYNAELAEMIENLDEVSVNNIIAARFMASLNQSEVETSEVHTAETNVSTDLNAEEDEQKIYINPVQAFLN